jgi:hypothetical protein
VVTVLPTTIDSTAPAPRPGVRRRLWALLLPLLFLVTSVAHASAAAAGPPLDSATRPVGSGVNRTLATSTWYDNRPATGTGRPAFVYLVSANGTDCSRSQVASVWLHRIQAGSGTILATGRLNNWNPCHSDAWVLGCCSGSYYSMQPVTGCWTCDYNLWSGPGGSSSPTDKQALRVFLFNSSGQQVGVVTLPYPG